MTGTQLRQAGVQQQREEGNQAGDVAEEHNLTGTEVIRQVAYHGGHHGQQGFTEQQKQRALTYRLHHSLNHPDCHYIKSSHYTPAPVRCTAAYRIVLHQDDVRRGGVNYCVWLS